MHSSVIGMILEEELELLTLDEDFTELLDTGPGPAAKILTWALSHSTVVERVPLFRVTVG